MVLGRRELGAILLGVAAIVFYLVLLSTSPSGAQTGGGTTSRTTNQNGDEGCENPEEVATFTGAESQITEPFDITGSTFRLSYEADLIESGDFQTGSLFIDTVREDGLTVPFGSLDAFSIEGPDSDSTNVLEGPGTFTLNIESRNVEYTVTVEDCVDDGDGTTTPQPTTRTTPDNNNSNRGEKSIINVPNKPLPPTGGFPVAATVAGFVLTGAGLLALGLVIRRGTRA